MFKMVIQGRLVEDAQVQQSKDGQSTFLSFRVAVNSFENKTNKAYFISVTTFNYRSNMVPFLKKGGLVEVIGTPRVEAFLSRQNVPMYDIHITADSIEFGNSGNGKPQEGTTQQTEVKNTAEPVEEQIIMTTSKTAKKQAEPEPVKGGNTQEFTPSTQQDDDDLPF